MARKTTKSPPKRLQVRSDLQLTHAGAQFLGGKRTALLERIESERSITRAARSVGLSYKSAWDALDAMNNVSPEPLFKTATGGRHGGGAELTDYGREVVRLYRALEAGHRRVLAGLEHEMHDAERLGGLLQAITLKTSARNQFAGKVSRVRKGAVNSEVILDVGNGLEICANITNESVKELELKKGKPAFALIKSSFVILTSDIGVRVSARNQIVGTVSAIAKGAVNSEVKLSLAGKRTLVAIVTNESVKELELKKGVPCCALVKSSHVLIAVNS